MLAYSKWAHDAVGIMILLAEAARKDGAGRSGTQLAAMLELGSALVAKQMRQLARAGLVTGRRGLNGGYRLAKPASEITLLEVVEVFSGRRTSETCSHCRPPLCCPLRESLLAVNQVSRDRLGALTLQECMDRSQGVEGIFPLACPEAPGHT